MNLWLNHISINYNQENIFFDFKIISSSTAFYCISSDTKKKKQSKEKTTYSTVSWYDVDYYDDDSDILITF